MPPSTPHDELFKRAFSRPENAVGELKRLLPPKTLARLDLDALSLRPGTFVDPALGARHVDVLFEVPIRGEAERRALIYLLFEHQSTSDPWMALRLLRYRMRIWDRFLEQAPRATKLPPILPIVVQHDPRGWRAATALHDLFPEALMADPTFAAVTPACTYLVDDLVRATDQELLEGPLSAFGRLVLWALRDARSARLLHTLPTFHPLLAELGASRHGDVDRSRILRYILDVQGRARFRRVIDLLPDSDVKEAAMTIAEELRREGERRGLRKGREEGLQKGLEKGLQKGLQQGRALLVLRLAERRFGALDDSARDRLARANADQLDALGDRLLTAATLDDFLVGLS